MTNLGDYLGQLMSEVVIARVHADLESVRVAELYASHPLLRHMPIPRVRLPEIQMEVPVVIDGSGSSGPNESPRGGTSIDAGRKQFDKVLATHLRSNNVRLRANQREALVKALDAEAKRPDVPIEIKVDTNRFADRFTDAAIGVLGESVSDEKMSGLKAGLKEDARLALLAARTAPPRVTALVETSAVREAGPEDKITRLQLTIREESMEVTACCSGCRRLSTASKAGLRTRPVRCATGSSKSRAPSRTTGCRSPGALPAFARASTLPPEAPYPAASSSPALSQSERFDTPLLPKC